MGLGGRREFGTRRVLAGARLKGSAPERERAWRARVGVRETRSGCRTGPATRSRAWGLQRDLGAGAWGLKIGACGLGTGTRIWGLVPGIWGLVSRFEEAPGACELN